MLSNIQDVLDYPWSIYELKELFSNISKLYPGIINLDSIITGVSRSLPFGDIDPGLEELTERYWPVCGIARGEGLTHDNVKDYLDLIQKSPYYINRKIDPIQSISNGVIKIPEHSSSIVIIPCHFRESKWAFLVICSGGLQWYDSHMDDSPPLQIETPTGSLKPLEKQHGPRLPSLEDSGIAMLIGIQLIYRGLPHIFTEQAEELVPSFRKQLEVEICANMIQPSINKKHFIEKTMKRKMGPITPEVVEIADNFGWTHPVVITAEAMPSFLEESAIVDSSNDINNDRHAADNSLTVDIGGDSMELSDQELFNSIFRAESVLENEPSHAQSSRVESSEPADPCSDGIDSIDIDFNRAQSSQGSPSAQGTGCEAETSPPQSSYQRDSVEVTRSEAQLSQGSHTTQVTEGQAQPGTISPNPQRQNDSMQTVTQTEASPGRRRRSPRQVEPNLSDRRSIADILSCALSFARLNKFRLNLHEIDRTKINSSNSGGNSDRNGNNNSHGETAKDTDKTQKINIQLLSELIDRKESKQDVFHRRYLCAKFVEMVEAKHDQDLGSHSKQIRDRQEKYGAWKALCAFGESNGMADCPYVMLCAFPLSVPDNVDIRAAERVIREAWSDPSSQLQTNLNKAKDICRLIVTDKPPDGLIYLDGHQFRAKESLDEITWQFCMSTNPRETGLLPAINRNPVPVYQTRL